MNFEYDLISAMREYDLHVNSINLEPGKYHRFRSLGTCKNKCCEYRIFEHQLGAHFKCFRRGIDRFWFHSTAERPSMAAQILMQEERDRINQERRRNQLNIAAKCARFFNHAETRGIVPTQHPYVLRKKIYPHGAMQVRGCIVLPVRDIDYRMSSLQFIRRNGFKQFKTGGVTSGNMIWLGDPIQDDYKGVIRICEGWSTGCTIYSITKSPVACALNAYNLLNVAVAIRSKYKHATSKICADNDQWGKENVGLLKGKEASLVAGLSLHYPVFDGLEVSHKPTDFNDLFLLTDWRVCKNQLTLIRK